MCILKNILATNRKISYTSEYATEMANFIILENIRVVVEAINTLIGDFDVFENLSLVYALFIIVVEFLKQPTAILRMLRNSESFHVL